jgi:hypothetical protein
MIAAARSNEESINGVSNLSRSLLSMYVEQPNEEVTLEDFEIAAFDRLKGECNSNLNLTS